MPRLKLDLPEAFQFETSIPIRISDINYGGHLGNDAVLSIVHESRVRFFASIGVSELDIGGAGVIMSDALIVFASEGKHGETLTIRVAASSPEGSRFDLFYQLVNASTDKEIARVKTGMACYDYSARKTVRVPESFAKALGF